jgi:outer membrane protein OmpA-like peptidoglycan-associated protein
LVLLLSFTVGCAVAQPAPDLSALKKKDQKTLVEARSALELGKFEVALPLLNGLIEKNPGQPGLRYLRAIANRETGSFEAAISDIRDGISSGGKVSSSAYKELGELYGMDGQFAEAVAAYEDYVAAIKASGKGGPDRVSKAEVLLARAQTAAALASSPVPFNPEPVMGGINSAEHLEYFPNLSVDGQRMIFTRRVNRKEEDFYVSELQPDGGWSVARPLDGVNTEFDEGAQSITADGRYLVFTACGRPDGAGSCDLYHTTKSEEGAWSVPRNLGSTINTRDYESQPSVSADGQLLFFTSKRPGGLGGADLYVSGRLPNGRWSDPVNLGPKVNTPGNDQYPFWASDGKTLFFTSDGHPGLGGDDLFRTELSPDNKWATPANLGYPINTADNETNLFVALGGDVAYFSKGKRLPGSGKMDVDIYQFDLPPALRPAAATYVEATVVDAETGKPLAATVRLRATDQTAPPTTRKTGSSGRFLAVLPAGKDYALTVDHPGYIFFTDRFSLVEGFSQKDPFRLSIALQPVKNLATAPETEEVDGAIAFRNVLFSSGSAELLPVSSDELDRLAELLTKADNFNVAIAGHTDDVGGEAANQELSEVRASAVKTYLVEKGIAASRITTAGYGESRPVTENTSEEGRARNRRTTFKLSE